MTLVLSLALILFTAGLLGLLLGAAAKDVKNEDHQVATAAGEHESSIDRPEPVGERAGATFSEWCELDDLQLRRFLDEHCD